VCQTLSKAWEISRKAAEQYFLVSSASLICALYTVSVVYCRVSLAKAELMVW
jgi:hypothetical protein